MTLLGNRGFADVIKLRIRSYWIRVGPKFNKTGVLIRRGKFGQIQIG